MTIDMNDVPVLSRVQVETGAGMVLQSAGRELGVTIRAPVDVEMIAENHLGLQILYCDLEALYGSSDIHGGLHIPEKRIMVEETLVDGRTNFTIGHELGHWVLHRHLAQFIDPNQSILFGAQRSKPVHRYVPTVCRTSDKSWGERQADWFSAALLMPAESIRKAFQRCFSSPRRFKRSVLDAFTAEFHTDSDGPISIHELDDYWEVLDVVNQVRDIGGFSNVSGAALRVRLQTLKLIIFDDAPRKLL